MKSTVFWLRILTVTVFALLTTVVLASLWLAAEIRSSVEVSRQEWRAYREDLREELRQHRESLDKTTAAIEKLTEQAKKITGDEGK